jgi:uncharacterized membrane protein
MMLDLVHLDLAHAGPAVAAAFLASLVEFVEALTIVLAVGTVRGWPPALLGTGAGLMLLIAVVAAAGPALAAIPISWLQIVVGVLLLLFGLRWLRKAVLRAAGIIPLHDEDKAFARTSDAMRRDGPVAIRWWDSIAVAAAFKAVVLEGLEVVFIVIAVGAAGNLLVAASVGAAAAGILVFLAGLALHRPLARVPENTLKYAVGIVLSGFGLFWTGEGLGVEWPGGDFAILAIMATLTLGSLAVVAVKRRRPATGQRLLPRY